mgnify:CR=1 FL=1
MYKVDGPREEALKILIKVFEDKSYSNILIKNLGQKYTSLDRSFITELVYGTIKYKLRIDYIISKQSNINMNKISPSILNILRMGIYQIDYLDRVPNSAAVDESVKLAKKYDNIGASKFVNGLLRNYCRRKDAISFSELKSDKTAYLSVVYSYPKWMVKAIIDDYGYEFTEDFLKYSNLAADTTIRVNRLKIDKETLKDKLTQNNIEVYNGRYMENSLVIKNIPGILNIDEYKEGYFTVQDESSMLAAYILNPKPGDFVMDVCASPGTKSTYMAEIMGNRGTIISGDIHKGKLKLVDNNSKRLGIDIISTIWNDAERLNNEFVGKADKLLVDAPCSGLGIMRKKPEIRWNRTIDEIKEIQNIQKSILSSSSKYLKVGGSLVYSTCTILKDENINMIYKFLDENKNFELEGFENILPKGLKKEDAKKGYIELFPNTDFIDGFFIAKMKRKA